MEQVSDIIARRVFDPLYIYLDIIFLLVFIFLLAYRKKYVPIVVGLVMGVVYMLVDYGIFHLWLGTRQISEGHSLFWVLLWMSMSYGFTNFSWIWLWLDNDKHLLEWSMTIVAWWFCCPLISRTFAIADTPIVIQRSTSAYHGGMAVIFFVSYLAVIVYNWRQHDKLHQINILRLFMIGVSVQLAWELALLVGGIRSVGFGLEQKLTTLAVNSLLETNLGMPAAFAIYIAISRRIDERFKPRQKVLSFKERVAQYNRALKPAKKA